MSHPFEDYYDSMIEDRIPWRDCCPEEYLARHWIEFGAFSISGNRFLNKDLERWVKRFEELLHDPKLIEECRSRFLTSQEREKQDADLRRIVDNGF